VIAVAKIARAVLAALAIRRKESFYRWYYYNHI
jgi:hypothetical protein